MPRYDVEQLYTKRAYYFGLMAFISFLIMQGLLELDKYTHLELPLVLPIILTIIFLFCSIACMYAIYKGRKERFSFRKIVAIMIAIASLGYIVLIIKGLFFF